jgi:hypothetical protein
MQFSHRTLDSSAFRTPALLTAAASLAVAVVLSGCAWNQQQPRYNAANPTEEMMRSTYPLLTQKGMATGFIVLRRPADSRGKAVPVLLTAAHLLASVDHGPLLAGVRVRDKSGEGLAVALALAPRQSGAQFYVRHPIQDVGALILSIPSEYLDLIKLFPVIDENALYDDDGLAPRAGNEVSFLGFPDVLPGTPGGFPILRTGHVASYPSAELIANHRFLIDTDVYPGDSGGPVFTITHGHAHLTGMIVERIGKQPNAFSHFAVAVDVATIRETLAQLR